MSPRHPRLSNPATRNPTMGSMRCTGRTLPNFPAQTLHHLLPPSIRCHSQLAHRTMSFAIAMPLRLSFSLVLLIFIRVRRSNNQDPRSKNASMRNSPSKSLMTETPASLPVSVTELVGGKQGTPMSNVRPYFLRLTYIESSLRRIAQHDRLYPLSLRHILRVSTQCWEIGRWPLGFTSAPGRWGRLHQRQVLSSSWEGPCIRCL
jgi:hypothetical protein